MSTKPMPAFSKMFFGMNLVDPTRSGRSMPSCTGKHTFGLTLRAYSTAMATNTWLILEFHDTNYSGDQYSNTPETLQAVVNYIVANHIPVVTTPEGIAMMN
jgi:hypothetical protein